jgi:hypothetical protein
MTATQLLALEQQGLVNDDLQRLGHAP